jgi:tetratricopeptide (TPR) repeat protein
MKYSMWILIFFGLFLGCSTQKKNDESVELNSPQGFGQTSSSLSSSWQNLLQDETIEFNASTNRDGFLQQHCEMSQTPQITNEENTSKDVTKWQHLALCKILEGKWTLAKKFYEKILSEDPTHFVALNNLGVLLAKEGELSLALTTFLYMREKYPFGQLPLFNLAKVHIELGNWSEGCDLYKALETFVEKGKFDPRVEEGKFICHLHFGHYDKALEQENYLPMAVKELPEIKLNRVYLNLKLKKKEAAQELFKKIPQPQSSDYWQIYYFKIQEKINL